MIIICPKCDARLRLDEAKLPSNPITVRCPKCQTGVDVQSPANAPNDTVAIVETAPTSLPFERQAAAPLFSSKRADSNADAQEGPAPGMDDMVNLLAQAIRRAGTDSTGSRGRKRPAWDRRRVLVCASPAYRDTIAESLAEGDYDVYLANSTAEGLGRMREDSMDVVILDANFDPLEQGVAFITREVKLLRPSERRRLFFVYLTATSRTMDQHAAFLHNVNLVINPSDVEQLPEAVEISIRHYNELYRDFNRALDLVPI